MAREERAGSQAGDQTVQGGVRKGKGAGGSSARHGEGCSDGGAVVPDLEV